jgi:hypothetical protein
LYWALGFNTPCNRIVYVAPRDLAIAPGASWNDALGHRHALRRDDVLRAIARGATRLDGTTRMSASLVVPGDLLGPMTDEGVRADDPNDRVPHQRRRELRGERLLAAWVNHWDARVPNTLDVFARDAAAGGSYVTHYMLDWGDALGGMLLTPELATRGGLAPIIDIGLATEDLAGLGFVRRPWDDDGHDTIVPMLRVNFDVAHFDPLGWWPMSPPERFSDARIDDLGWMARRIARITPAHLARILDEAQFRDPRLAPRLLEILLGRRDRALRTVFARSSPLGELTMAGADRLCMVDLGIASGVSAPEGTSFRAELYAGAARDRVPGAVALARGAGAGELCADFVRRVAPATAALDDEARYAELEVSRQEGGHRTLLRAYFYDLGPERGYALVGVERP